MEATTKFHRLQEDFVGVLDPENYSTTQKNQHQPLHTKCSHFMAFTMVPDDPLKILRHVRSCSVEEQLFKKVKLVFHTENIFFKLNLLSSYLSQI
jgi:hypothetical protein